MRTLPLLLTLSLAAPALADTPTPADAPVAAPAAAATPAAAPDADALQPIVLQVPERCAPVAKRALMPSRVQALAGRIALASCVADANLAPLSLIDGEESVLAIDNSVAPAFALLDQVLDAADAPTKIMALRAKADLYTLMTNKMLMTVPALTTNTPEAAELHETRRQIVEGMIKPWRDNARESHQLIVDIARAHPELAKNPVVQTAVRDSEHQIAQPVATRE